MITRIEATNYRCFDQLDVELGGFRVLVGANGSGKTTLLDIPLLISDLLQERSIGSAFTERKDGLAPRANALPELIFQGRGDFFILALEARLPESKTAELLSGSRKIVRARSDFWPTHLRYEIRFQIFNENELQVQNEYLFAFPAAYPPDRPEEGSAPRLHGEVGFKKQWRPILRREYGGDAEYMVETSLTPKVSRSRMVPQQLGLPRVQFESVADFPAARWLFELLVDSAVFFDPQWNDLRTASAPGMPQHLIASARNMPWLALELQRNGPDRFDLWKRHVHLALPQVSDISIHERDDDHHAYFRVRYMDRYDVPSSGLSDGTLRVLVLTLLPYLSGLPAFLVTEEPENGIHPRAIQAVMEGLASISGSQVIVSSHSPVVLANTELSQLLAARLGDDGSAQVVQGPKHPQLVDWKGEVSLPTLFAAGVLG